MRQKLCYKGNPKRVFTLNNDGSSEKILVQVIRKVGFCGISQTTTKNLNLIGKNPKGLFKFRIKIPKKTFGLKNLEIFRKIPKRKKSPKIKYL